MREQVRHRAGQRCEYCQMPEECGFGWPSPSIVKLPILVPSIRLYDTLGTALDVSAFQAKYQTTATAAIPGVEFRQHFPVSCKTCLVAKNRTTLKVALPSGVPARGLSAWNRGRHLP